MKIIVLTTEDSPYSPLLLGPLLTAFPNNVRAIVTAGGGSSSSRKKIRSVVNQAGWDYVLKKLLLFAAVRKRQWLGLYPSIESLARKHKIERVHFTTMKSDDALQFFQTEWPDFLISVLFEKIIPPEILRSCQYPINLHPAPLPRYAGIAPTFWALANNETETAVTVHRIEESIDTGNIFGSRSVSILPGDSVHALYLRCCEVGSKILVDVVNQLSKAPSVGRAQDFGKRTYFKQPTKEAYQSLLRNGHSLYSFRHLVRPLHG